MSFQDRLLDIILFSLIVFENIIDAKDKQFLILFSDILKKNPDMFWVDVRAERLLQNLEKNLGHKNKNLKETERKRISEIKALITHLSSLPPFPIFVHENKPPHKKQNVWERHIMNKKLGIIKTENENKVLNQIRNKHLIEKILHSALNARSNTIVLLDGANIFFRMFGRHMKITKINKQLINAIMKDAGIPNKKTIFWVILNQGSLNDKGEWTTVFESTHGMIINVACRMAGKDCYLQPNMPNPMDDLAILVLSEGLKRLIKYLSFNYSLPKKAFPSISVLTKDKYRDFRLVL